MGRLLLNGRPLRPRPITALTITILICFVFKFCFLDQLAGGSGIKKQSHPEWLTSLHLNQEVSPLLGAFDSKSNHGSIKHSTLIAFSEEHGAKPKKIEHTDDSAKKNKPLTIRPSKTNAHASFDWHNEAHRIAHPAQSFDVLKLAAEKRHSSKVKYFFALDLYNNREILPRLLGTLVQVAKILGPEKCGISIVGGLPTDGTGEVLTFVKEYLFDKSGINSWLVESTIDSNDHVANDRIAAPAALRNLALTLLWENESAELFNEATVIVFINDVVMCPEDVYELLFQHQIQDATMSCSMDWVFHGKIFYDSWVSRSMSGDMFFEIPQDIRLAFTENLFWDHELSQDKWQRHQALQVYSCWGGMVALDSKPFLHDGIRFRNPAEGECYMGEPMTLAKELWKSKQGRVQVVPAINVAYSDREALFVKGRRGYVHEFVDIHAAEQYGRAEKIAWKDRPPGQVKCQPEWGPKRWWVDSM